MFSIKLILWVFSDPGLWNQLCFAFSKQFTLSLMPSFSLVMYGLSLSEILYADFPDKIIYVHLLIENLIFEVIILIDVCHFDQATACRCFVKTILQVSLSPCLSRPTFSMTDWEKNHRDSKRGNGWQTSHIHAIFFTTEIILLQWCLYSHGEVQAYQIQRRKTKQEEGQPHQGEKPEPCLPQVIVHISQRGCAQFLSNSFTCCMTAISEVCEALADGKELKKKKKRNEKVHISLFLDFINCEKMPS